MSRRKIFELFGSIVIEGTAKNKKALTQLQKDLRATNQRLNKMGRDAKKVGVAITKNLTAPLLGLAAASVKVGADFEKAMTDSLSIMDNVNDSMRKDMSDTARQVAKDMNLAADSVAEAYFFLASANLDAEKSMKALPIVAAFAKAGNFDLAKATDLLTDTQSALGLASEDTATHMNNMIFVSDLLTQANKNANSSSQEFSEALTNKAAVAAEKFKRPLSDVLSVLEVLADKGFAKGLKAGEKYDALLTSLANAATNNAQAFKDANIEVFDAEDNMRNMADIVEDLTGRFDGMSDRQRTAELQQLGFTESAAATASALFGTSDALREYQDQLVSTGQTNQVVAEKLESFWEQVGLARRGIEDLGIELSERLLPILKEHIIPAIEKLTDAIKTMFEWFEDHPALRDFVEAFVLALATIGPLLILFAKLIPLIKTVILVYKGLAAGQTLWNIAMATNPIGLVITAIGLLIAAGWALYQNWDTISGLLLESWEKLPFGFWKITDAIIVRTRVFILEMLKEFQKLGQFMPGIASMLDTVIEKHEKNLELAKAEALAREDLRMEWLKEVKLKEEAAIVAEEAARIAILAAEAQEVQAAANAAAADVRSLEEIERLRALGEEREKWEEKWTDELFRQSHNRMEILEAEHIAALEEAKRLGSDKEEVDLFYQNKKIELERKTAKEQLDISRQLAKEQALLIDDDLARLRATTDQKIIDNEWEKNEAVRIANEKGIDTAALTELYKARENRIISEAAVQEIKISDTVRAERVSDVKSVFSTIGDFVGKINKLWQGSVDKRSTEIDNEAEKRKEAIENSVMGEQEKAEALALIDAETAAKKKVLEREEAIRQKAAAIFGIAIATSLAVAQALPNVPLSVAVGILGAAEGIAVAATPIPLAEGALIRSDPGRGVLAQVGEGSQDEIVLPMKTGAIELADNIFSKIKSFGGLGGSVQQAVAPSIINEVHIHAGNVIADEFSVKTFAKKINKAIISNNQRTGIA